MAGQSWSPDGSGGYLANSVLSKKMRHASQPMMRARQFVRKESGYGKHKSDTLLFDRISNVATAGTTIAELSKMPETNFAITQGSVIVNEFGNSIPYTGKLDALSEFSVSNIVLKALKNDMAKALDRAAMVELQTCQVKYAATGTDSAPTGTFDTDGTQSTAFTRDVQAFDVKEIVDYFNGTLFTPPFDGENFICIASVGFARAIKDDPDWEDASKYGDPERLFSGEVGRYYGCRFVVEANVLASLVDTSYKGEAIFFGEDPMIEAVAVAEEIRSKIPTDYGRDPGLAWYFLGNWGLTYDTATAGEAKIIHAVGTA